MPKVELLNLLPAVAGLDEGKQDGLKVIHSLGCFSRDCVNPLVAIPVYGREAVLRIKTPAHFH